jgi:hypothetical protein
LCHITHTEHKDCISTRIRAYMRHVPKVSSDRAYRPRK